MAISSDAVSFDQVKGTLNLVNCWEQIRARICTSSIHCIYSWLRACFIHGLPVFIQLEKTTRSHEFGGEWGPIHRFLAAGSQAGQFLQGSLKSCCPVKIWRSELLTSSGAQTVSAALRITGESLASWRRRVQADLLQRSFLQLVRAAARQGLHN